MARKQYYEVEGKVYSVAQLVNKTCKSATYIRLRLKQGANTFEDFNKRAEYNRKHVKRTSARKGGQNWKESMMVDEFGHWKLLSKALGC